MSDVISGPAIDTAQPTWIFVLPNELLGIVLAAVAELDPPFSPGPDFPPSGEGKRSDALGFLRLSEVCWRFHAVLLSMPKVWANIVFNLPVRMSLVALSRSGLAPIPVDIHHTYALNSHNGPGLDDSHSIREFFIALACRMAARLGSFTIQHFPAAQHRILFSKPLLMIKKLDMFYGGPPDPDDLGTMCIDAPVLEVVQLTFMEDADLPFFHAFGRGVTFKLPELQWLRIAVECPFSDDDMKPRWIANILQNSPRLTHFALVIDTASIPIDWRPLFGGRSARLLHLKSLELSGSPGANLAGFVDHLECRPARLVVEFHHSEEETVADEEEALLQVVEAFGPLLRRPTYNGLLVDLNQDDDDSVLELRTFPSLHDLRQISFKPLEFANTSEIVQLYIKSYLPDDSPVHSQITDIVAEVLKYSEITQLAVCSPALSRWPFALESILSACTATAELLVCLPYQRDSNDHGFLVPMSPEALPVLDSMFFLNEANEDVYHSCWAECVDWLAWRAQIGRRIRRLCVLGQTDRQDIGEGEDREGTLVRRAAALVEEFTDERVYRKRSRSSGDVIEMLEGLGWDVD